jgi:hydrogenase nickel incorporation protein HypA/HybF
MHEYSIVQSLLGQVQHSISRYDVASVRSVRVRIGSLSGVDPELLRTAYDLCVPGTLCAGAKLEIEYVPVLWRCPRCDQNGREGQPLTCTACGVPMRLVAGDEIVLEKIDLEVNDV